MSLEDDLRTIRTGISSLQASKARAQVEHENAAEQLKLARAGLKDRFGVETNDQLKEVLEQLTNDLESAISEVTKELEAAGV